MQGRDTGTFETWDGICIYIVKAGKKNNDLKIMAAYNDSAMIKQLD